MQIDRLDILDNTGGVLFTYSSEYEIVIHNISILGKQKGTALVLMIKDYTCPNKPLQYEK